MNDRKTLKNCITRAKRKLTTLRKRQQEQSPDFEYWLTYLKDMRQALYELELAAIAAKRGPVTIGKLYAADGGVHVRVSTASGQYIQNIDKSLVPPDKLEKMQCIADYRNHSNVCCVRGCNRKDTQLHHWAPRHLFENAENWPTDYLCKNHHDLWHSLIPQHWTVKNGR